MKLMDELTFNDQGLIPVIIANVEDGRPLTLCYMNREALAEDDRDRQGPRLPPVEGTADAERRDQRPHPGGERPLSRTARAGR